MNFLSKTVIWLSIFGFFLHLSVHSELPKSQFILEKNGFSLSYDGRTKQASWVLEEITKESLNSIFDRTDFYFAEDTLIPKVIRSTLQDYKGSGYDRGHLASAADQASCESSLRDSFLLSNVSPQTATFNRGFWGKLEQYVRQLVNKHDKITIITGPIILHREAEDGRRYVCYEVIGSNNVAVPTHYFKIIRSSSHEEAYILPNEKIDNKVPLENFLSTIEEIERISGIVFVFD